MKKIPRTMIRLAIPLLLVSSPAQRPAAAAEAACPLVGRRILVLGDSITNHGRWVSYVEFALRKRFPEARVDIVSIGLGSETVSGLSEEDHPFPRPCVFERLDRALAAVKPGLVVACYGMNDGIYHPPSPERMQAYRDGIMKLVRAAEAAGARVILATPPPFDPVPIGNRVQGAGGSDYGYKKPYEKYDEVLAGYGQWLLGLRDPAVIAVADIHGPMAAYLGERRKTEPGFTFSRDGIHPDNAGHLLMARAVLAAAGVAWAEDGTPAETAKAMEEDPLFKLVDTRRRLRSTAWLDYVGYTRGKTVKTASVDEAERRAAELDRDIGARLRRAR